MYKSDVDKFNFGKYDLIVSNPPYINKHNIKYLERDVAKFEPKIALDGGLDGLSEIRKVIKKSSELIKKNGKFVLVICFILKIIVNNIDQEAQIFNNNSSKNYIKIKLKGSDLNPFGIGARVFDKSCDLNQMLEMTLSRGFQSSVSPEFHFGLSDNTSIDLISIEWPNGNYYELANPEINQLITLDIKDSYSNEKTNSKNDKLLFVSEEIVEYKHIENDYNDYEKEVLLPHQNSRLGPGIATGDINGDGLDDVFMGRMQPDAGYELLQQEDGSFIFNRQDVYKKLHSWPLTNESSHSNLLLDSDLIDINNDGYDDLVVGFGHGSASSLILVNDDGKFSENSLHLEFNANAVLPSDPGALPKPRSILLPCRVAKVPNCSAITNGL